VKQRKNILYAIATIALLATIATVWAQTDLRTCHSINIDIQRKEEAYYITEKQIQNLLSKNNITAINKPANSINLTQIEKIVETNPYVQAYINIIGNLTIKIAQRNPILRIINQYGNTYYIDKEQHKMPLSASYTPYIMVANGSITETLTQADTIQTRILKQIHYIAQYIHENDFLDPLVVQIYANTNQDIELSTRLWNHTVLIGDTSNLAQKFEQMQHFYTHAPKYKDIDKYKQIVVKYKNQIVAVK
jgi:cell division protein FtsQ